MKIAVVGTGAMGSVYAALLAEAANEVWAVDLGPGPTQCDRAQQRLGHVEVDPNRWTAWRRLLGGIPC
jgi:ketopantoate reductase